MIELVEGKVTGTLEIPWKEVPLRYLFTYSGIDFTQFTPEQVIAMTGMGESAVRNAASKNGFKLQPPDKELKQEQKISRLDEQAQTVCRRIKMGMAALDETEEDLAKALGVSQQTVSRWLVGRRTPGEEMFRKLAEHFCETVDFMKGTPDVIDKSKWGKDQKDAYKTLLKYREKISACDFGTLLGMINEGRYQDALKGLGHIMIRNQKKADAAKKK